MLIWLSCCFSAPETPFLFPTAAVLVFAEAPVLSVSDTLFSDSGRTEAVPTTETEAAVGVDVPFEATDDPTAVPLPIPISSVPGTDSVLST